MESSRSWLLAAVLLLGMPAARPLVAQVDYRNLDDGRPTRVTDAYPVERFAFEFSVGGRLRGRQGFASPHLEYGVVRNLMVGVGAELGAPGSHAEVSALWNARRETPGFPAVSVSAAIGLDPVIGLLATRSFGLARLHFNGALDLSGPAGWWGGLAADRTLFRRSTLVVTEVVAERVGGGQPVEWSAAVGLRRQITPTVVLHGGASQGFGRLGTEINFGLSYAFAIAGLMPRGPR